ncbi:hypothetical protein [Comamonas antarctica]|uniref:hypothetical protein n=1 Tax=Comamonas antarctica TaxID=2743470 RepID=UPI0028EB2022|nr:hypothetical protein [Comamonas antarctica]
MLKKTLWKLAAVVLSRPTVTRWLIRRARRTPYFPILGRGNDLLYMDRWWVFNAYGKNAEGRTAPPRWPWLPSIRVHHICQPDDDDHEHDHPWDARTIILKGWYVEERRTHCEATRVMRAGQTAVIVAGQFHRIARVSDGGVYTLFFTWQYISDWGFWVEGQKVLWREYLEARSASLQ